MCQFIESICFVNGKLRNLELHQNRFDSTRKHFYPNSVFLSLKDEIIIPENLTKEKYKVRVIYSDKIEKIEFLPYQPKKINSIKLISIDEDFDYKFKYLDRSFFDDLLNKSNFDDLILVQNDCITDAIYSNLIFYNGKEWHTPKKFLLPGILRQSLLNSKKIVEKEIKVSDLKNYVFFKRINAMMSFDEAETLDIKILNTDDFI